jgi:KaiC/GvpD/RAD55 family RecA-like ATPase
VNVSKNVFLCGPCGAQGGHWALAAFLARIDPNDKPAVTAWLRERGLLDVSKGPRTSAGEFRRVAGFRYSPDLRKVRLERPATNGSKPEKSFRWEHRENDRWLPGAGDFPKPLYVNALFRESDQLGLVLGFEGERKADLAGELGFAAFSFKNLTVSHCDILAGLDVVLWPDADVSGLKQCSESAKVMHESRQPRLIRVIAPPAELPASGDIVDAVRSLGWGKSEIDKLIVEAKTFALPAAGAVEQKPGAILDCFADIAPESVKWLWPGQIPLGKLTLLIGDPGLGKSLVTIDIASRVTRGSVFPDGASCAAGSVIFLSAEDDAGDTIRPRLDAAGADVSRAYLLKAVRVILSDGLPSEKSFSLETDVTQLEDALRQRPDVRLIVIDPISAYLGGTDSHSNAEIRGLLAPLTALAARYGVAILAVTHLRKAPGAAVHRAISSIAFAAAARAVWAVAPDPDDSELRLMLPVKQNLAANTGGFAFRIEAPNGTARLVWDSGTVRADVNDVLGGFEDRETRSARREAEEWLRDVLADGPVAVTKIQADAKSAGIAGHTLRDAATALRVQREKIGFKLGWEWSLPKDAPAEDAVTHTRENGTFEKHPENAGDSEHEGAEDAVTQHNGTFRSNSHVPDRQTTRPCSHCNRTGSCLCPLCRQGKRCSVCHGMGRVATGRAR